MGYTYIYIHFVGFSQIYEDTQGSHNIRCFQKYTDTDRSHMQVIAGSTWHFQCSKICTHNSFRSHLCFFYAFVVANLIEISVYLCAGQMEIIGKKSNWE